MAKRFTPRGVSWNELSQELRGLQNRISLNQGRFKEVGRHDIAEDLEKVYPSTDSRANGCRRALQPGRVILAKRKRPPTNRPVATIMNGADYRTLLLSDERWESVHPFFVLGFLRASTRFIFSGTTRYHVLY